MNYFLHFGVMLTIEKTVHHPIPTRENREQPGNFQNKSVSSALKLSVQVYSLFGISSFGFY